MFLNWIITIALLGSIDNILAKRAVFNDACCNYNREVFSNFTLQIPKGVMNLDVVLVSPLLKGVRGHLSFEFRTSKSRTYQTVFEYDLDYCKFKNGITNTITRRWFLSILKISNFSTACPVQPGYYYMHGWKINGNLVPLFLATGDYRVAGSFYYGKFQKNNDKPLLKCTVEATLVE